MKNLLITKLTAVSTRGENKRPCSGNVEFSDGKYYGWFLEMDGETIVFDVGYQKPSHGGWERKSFHSTKRQKLVTSYLNSNDVCVEVFRVRMEG